MHKDKEPINKQLSLGKVFNVPSKEFTPAVDFRKFSEGDYAATVISQLLDGFAVKQFSYTEYNPISSYAEKPLMDEKKQPFIWQEWSDINIIEKKAENILNRSLFTLIFEGELYYISNIMAIASKVKLSNGAIRHIPMLDFEFSSGFQKEDLKLLEKTSLPPGLLLETDASYHYYGFDLMDQSTWREWMEGLVLLENKEALFGPSFIEYCLERGCAALRTYGYPGTFKAKSPRVVMRI